MYYYEMSDNLNDYLEIMQDINIIKKVDNDSIRNIVNIVVNELKKMSDDELEKLYLLREEDKKFIKSNFVEIWIMSQKKLD